MTFLHVNEENVKNKSRRKVWMYKSQITKQRSRKGISDCSRTLAKMHIITKVLMVNDAHISAKWL